MHTRDKSLRSDDTAGQTSATDFEKKRAAHYSSSKSHGCLCLCIKNYFLQSSWIFFCEQHTIGIRSGLSRPAVRHVITAVTHLSAVVSYKVGELQERVTLWPALTEEVNHVFINTL